MASFSPLKLLLITLSIVSGTVAQYGAMQIAEGQIAKGLSPRYYLGLSPQPQLARRDGSCAASSHTCLDVGEAGIGSCCPNTQYCITNSSFQVQCCDIGSLCSNQNPCDSTAYACPSTTTISSTATVVVSCCPRSCPVTSAFLCAASLGGGCCNFGYACASSKSCVSTAQPTTSAVVSEIPSGCTTSQITCATSLGGGCCNDGYECTVLSNTNYCAEATNTPMRTGPDGIYASNLSQGSSGGGLSSGAKAGIGAGVVVGALVVIGGLLWFCMAQRRRAKQRETEGSDSVPALSQDGSKVTRPGQGRNNSGYFGPTAAAGPFSGDHLVSPTSPGTNSRGVPLTPQSPGDIAVPVEIDSKDPSNVTSPGVEYKSPTVTAEPVEMP